MVKQHKKSIKSSKSAGANKTRTTSEIESEIQLLKKNNPRWFTKPTIVACITSLTNEKLFLANANAALIEAEQHTIHVPREGAFDVQIADCAGLPISSTACHHLIGVDKVVAESMDIIKAELPRDRRVPPLMFSRLARGGKSTVVNEIFKRLQLDGINCILITFCTTDGFMRRDGETQGNAILRLIAAQLVLSIPNLHKQHIECNEVELDKYIGKKEFVLLIDELNVISGNNPLDGETVQLLHRMFLDRANRYLVFTTHVPLDVDQFRSIASSSLAESSRGVRIVPMPEETNLEEIRKMDGCAEVTSAEVSLYGAIPSLIHSIKGLKEMAPDLRFQRLRPPRVDGDSLLNELITELVNGDRLTSHRNLRQFDRFSSAPSLGKIRWPLCFINCLIKECTVSPITRGLIKRITAIEVLAQNTVSGKDWECIVQFSLIVRCCYQQIHGEGCPFSDVDQFVPEGVKPVVFVRSLVSQTAAAAHAEIWRFCETIVESALCLFFPTFSSFPTFDGFIVYHVPGQAPHVVGVQMKLGRDCPKERGDEFDWVSRGYLVRGNPANASYDRNFWYYLNNDEIDTLVGYSLRSMRPRHWPEEPVNDELI